MRLVPRCIIQSMIETAILALGSGAAEGILALSVILIYRTSGVINLALAGSGTLGTFIAYSVAQGHPLWLAVTVGSLAGAATTIAAYAVISGIRSRHVVISAAIASCALAVLFQWVVEKLWSGMDTFPSAFAPTLVTLGRWQIPQLYVAALLTGFGIAIAMSAYLHWMQPRAIKSAEADRPRPSQCAGANTKLSAVAVWAAAGALASLSGFFQAQIVFDYMFLVTLFPAALLAALCGGLRNLPIAFVAAVALEVSKILLENHFVAISSDTVTYAETVLAILVISAWLLAPPGWLHRLKEHLKAGQVRV